MRTILVYIFLLINISACSQDRLYDEFLRELKNKESKVKIIEETFTDKNITFNIPSNCNSFAKQVILGDINSLKSNKDYTGSTITYVVKQNTESFVSIIRKSYKEEFGTSKGYSSWSNSLVFIKNDSQLYKVNLNLADSTIKRIVLQEIEKESIEKECLDELFFSNEHINFYFLSGELFLNNPINYPTCWIDIRINIQPDMIRFQKIL